MNKYRNFIAKYGKKEFFLTLVYPLSLPFLMIRDTGMSLWLIMNGLSRYNWKYLSGNDQKNGYNNLFYYLQDLAVQESGRYGNSRYLNGGDFSLAKLFHLTPVSLRFQASFGTVFMMFFAMCMWLASWVVLYGASWFVIGILGVVLFSTLFYACFIEIQNYNILGWMLYPIMLYYLADGNIFNSTMVLFLISFLSFTATVLAIPFVITFSIDEPLLSTALIPAMIKILIPIFRSGQIFTTLDMINGGKKVKYSRSLRLTIYWRAHLKKLYLFIMLGQFAIAYTFLNGFDEFAFILIGTVVLFFINQSFFRIADEQSFYILYLSVSTFILLNASADVLTLISFGLSVFLIYKFMPNVHTQAFLTPGTRKPFSVLSDIEKLQILLADIPENGKVIMAYKNPEGQYANIFNGYCVYNEPIQYAASLKGLSYMPDWYTIFSNNKEDSPEGFWIDTPNKAISYMLKYNINYLIVPEFVKGFTDDKRFKHISEYTFQIDKNKKYTIILYKLNRM